MPTEPKTIRIFYAWQSDLPEQFNHHAIRQALHRATVMLAKEVLSTGRVLNHVVDDAKREMVASGHIPQPRLSSTD